MSWKSLTALTLTVIILILSVVLIIVHCKKSDEGFSFGLFDVFRVKNKQAIPDNFDVPTISKTLGSFADDDFNAFNYVLASRNNIPNDLTVKLGAFLQDDKRSYLIKPFTENNASSATKKINIDTWISLLKIQKPNVKVFGYKSESPYILVPSDSVDQDAIDVKEPTPCTPTSTIDMYSPTNPYYAKVEKRDMYCSTNQCIATNPQPLANMTSKSCQEQCSSNAQCKGLVYDENTSKCWLLNGTVGSIAGQTTMYVKTPSYPYFTLRHKQSGKCVHPKSGGKNVPEGTPLVLHSDSCEAQDQRIQFFIDGSGIIRHRLSGACLTAQYNGDANNRALTLSYMWCDQPWEFTSGGSLRHKASGRCVHLLNDSTENDTPLVVFDGCDQEKLIFAREFVQDFVCVPNETKDEEGWDIYVQTVDAFDTNGYANENGQWRFSQAETLLPKAKYVTATDWFGKQSASLMEWQRMALLKGFDTLSYPMSKLYGMQPLATSSFAYVKALNTVMVTNWANGGLTNAKAEPLVYNSPTSTPICMPWNDGKNPSTASGETPDGAAPIKDTTNLSLNNIMVMAASPTGTVQCMSDDGVNCLPGVCWNGKSCLTSPCGRVGFDKLLPTFYPKEQKEQLLPAERLQTFRVAASIPGLEDKQPVYWLDYSKLQWADCPVDVCAPAYYDPYINSFNALKNIASRDNLALFVFVRTFGNQYIWQQMNAASGDTRVYMRQLNFNAPQVSGDAPSALNTFTLNPSGLLRSKDGLFACMTGSSPDDVGWCSEESNKLNINFAQDADGRLHNLANVEQCLTNQRSEWVPACDSGTLKMQTCVIPTIYHKMYEDKYADNLKCLADSKAKGVTTQQIWTTSSNPKSFNMITCQSQNLSDYCGSLSQAFDVCGPGIMRNAMNYCNERKIDNYNPSDYYDALNKLGRPGDILREYPPVDCFRATYDSKYRCDNIDQFAQWCPSRLDAIGKPWNPSWLTDCKDLVLPKATSSCTTSQILNNQCYTSQDKYINAVSSLQSQNIPVSTDAQRNIASWCEPYLTKNDSLHPSEAIMVNTAFNSNPVLAIQRCGYNNSDLTRDRTTTLIKNAVATNSLPNYDDALTAFKTRYGDTTGLPPKPNIDCSMTSVAQPSSIPTAWYNGHCPALVDYKSKCDPFFKRNPLYYKQAAQACINNAYNITDVGQFNTLRTALQTESPPVLMNPFPDVNCSLTPTDLNSPKGLASNNVCKTPTAYFQCDTSRAQTLINTFTDCITNTTTSKSSPFNTADGSSFTQADYIAMKNYANTAGIPLGKPADNSDIQTVFNNCKTIGSKLTANSNRWTWGPSTSDERFYWLDNNCQRFINKAPSTDGSTANLTTDPNVCYYGNSFIPQNNCYTKDGINYLATEVKSFTGPLNQCQVSSVSTKPCAPCQYGNARSRTTADTLINPFDPNLSDDVKLKVCRTTDGKTWTGKVDMRENLTNNPMCRDTTSQWQVFKQGFRVAGSTIGGDVISFFSQFTEDQARKYADYLGYVFMSYNPTTKAVVMSNTGANGTADPAWTTYTRGPIVFQCSNINAGNACKAYWPDDTNIDLWCAQSIYSAARCPSVPSTPPDPSLSLQTIYNTAFSACSSR